MDQSDSATGNHLGDPGHHLGDPEKEEDPPSYESLYGAREDSQAPPSYVDQMNMGVLNREQTPPCYVNDSVIATLDRGLPLPYYIDVSTIDWENIRSSNREDVIEEAPTTVSCTKTRRCKIIIGVLAAVVIVTVITVIVVEVISKSTTLDQNNSNFNPSRKEDTVWSDVPFPGVSVTGGGSITWKQTTQASPVSRYQDLQPFCPKKNMYKVADDGIVFGAVSWDHSPADPLPLRIVTGSLNQWNTIVNSFCINDAAGVYFLGLSVGVPEKTKANYTLKLSGREFGGISRTSNIEYGGKNVDVISHDFIIYLNPSDTLHVSSEQPTYSTYLETSLSIFSISGNMVDDRTAFSVARTDSIYSHTEPVPFNIHIYNVGRHYSPLNHTYTVPSAGIYYFSFSVGLVAHSTAEFVLYKNSEPYVNIVRNSTSHSGTDTIGRAIMMSLSEGDHIYMVNEAGETARSSPMMETSFSGFKYEPKHGNMVAWSVARNTSQISHWAPAKYPVILVNQGGAWKPASDRVIVPKEGHYFLHVSGGVPSGQYAYLDLQVNKKRTVLTSHTNRQHNGTDTMARSAILYLSAGDELQVLDLYGTYSDNQMQTVFIGFLI